MYDGDANFVAVPFAIAVALIVRSASRQGAARKQAEAKTRTAQASARDSAVPPREHGPPLLPDPRGYQGAVQVLGLAKGFTQSDLRARYLELMRAAHPDVAGDAEVAAWLNVARETIKQIKGWS